ncbi:amidase family protein [Legionella gratiana]|uniref:amidase family protein n=1 Tax=Legionella gratiana TaxID=45066 RepID=UPI0009F97F3E
MKNALKPVHVVLCDGSIIKPSSAAAIVGLKPTVGLISRSGVIPLAFSYDTPGPMTRTVCSLSLA